MIIRELLYGTLQGGCWNSDKGEQTAGSTGLRQKYITALALAGDYILLYAVVWCVILGLKKKRMVT